MRKVNNVESEGYKHYIRIDDESRVIHGFSDAFEQSQSGDICILENAPRHFHESFPEPLQNDEGILLFKWDGDEVVERTEQEIQDDIDALPEPEPTDRERLEALEAALLEVILGGQVSGGTN